MTVLSRWITQLNSRRLLFVTKMTLSPQEQLPIGFFHALPSVPNDCNYY